MIEKEDQISSQLDKLIRLVSMIATKDMSQKQQVAQLSKAGLQPKDIADLIGTTPHTVSVTLSDIKKQSSSKVKKTPNTVSVALTMARKQTAIREKAGEK